MTLPLKNSIKSVREARIVVEAPAATTVATADFIAIDAAGQVVSSSVKTYRLADRGRVEIPNLNRMLQIKGQPAPVSMKMPADSLTE